MKKYSDVIKICNWNNQRKSKKFFMEITSKNDFEKLVSGTEFQNSFQ